MSKWCRIWILLLFTINAVSLEAKEPEAYNEVILSFTNSTPQSVHQADSIMAYVIKNASLYANAISRYSAEIYIKGQSETVRSNRLLRYAHHLFPVDRKKNKVIFEIVSESEYDAPNHYLHNFKAINGNAIPNHKKQQEIFTFLNVNVYSPTMYNEAIITPVGKKAFRYYEFNLEEVIESGGKRVYKIRFIPRQWSQKLVSGDLYIRDDEWRIEKVDMYGRFAFADFNIEMIFGHEYGQLILPNTANLSLTYDLLGNTVVSKYYSSFRYKEVEWKEILPRAKKEKHEWKSLDLTKYYTLSSDSIPIIKDSIYWEEKRDIPLTDEEKETFSIHYPSGIQKRDSSQAVDYMEITEQLTSSMNYKSQTTRIRYSGILNPFQLGYSSRNGITYRQQLRITKTFRDESQLAIIPEVGYMFKNKELFYKLRTDWNYLPEKRGVLKLTLANNNQTYSSQMMRQINEHFKDSVFDFDDLNLEYYRHYYIDLRNRIEISNGLEFDAGVSYHRRVPVIKKAAVDPGEEIEEMIKETYYDFTPTVALTYTPRQFYHMSGRKKEYAYSYYPTMSVSYAQGIPDVLKSSGNYGRIEADIHQSLKAGSFNRLYYHVSGGMYTKKKSIYFADFEYFTRQNFPESWSDHIGGVFCLLKREWFNASDKYVQAHLMYESPFIFFHRLLNRKSSRYVVTERLYLSQLWTPLLPNYTEVGYGIGNSVFNVGVFASFDRFKYQRIGFKFAFEIGQ